MLLELACLIRLAAVAIVSQRFRLRALQRLTFAPSTLLMETPAPAAAAAAKSARDMPGVTVMAAPRTMLRPSVPRRVTPTSVSSEQRVASGEGWTMGFMAVSKDMIIHSPPVLNLRSVSYAGIQTLPRSNDPWHHRCDVLCLAPPYLLVPLRPESIWHAYLLGFWGLCPG